MEDSSLNTFLAILTGVVLMVIMAVFIITIVVIHRQRQIKNRHKIQILKADYENTILNAEKEIREQTLHHVSQELHDNIGQLLSLTKLVLNNPDGSGLGEGRKLINQVIREVRGLSKSINRDYIRELAFEHFLKEELARIEKTGYCTTAFEQSGDPVDMLEGDKKLVLIRMVQECLNNAIKHASPSLISIKLSLDENELVLVIADDGIGFDTSQTSNGLGIKNLKSRIQAIEGRVEVNSVPDAGTEIRIMLERGKLAHDGKQNEDLIGR
ncbi:Histidine kinase-, DNA gyrase B-, and HSP90-like ATPase [Cyclobacterium lianum]|uniref:histidine kinase n=1 Tax=Cyclobacterium lianum TaxID=388280 RepID=A0A1M7I4E5_9BACT|nr:ATP-binding protein [Cyclobacterium lianum]SHM35661.1 Histidine kinase-, DNA gyrase B-, and HSP90-like ATPase [Cyclobacterium lianum]